MAALSFTATVSGATAGQVLTVPPAIVKITGAHGGADVAIEVSDVNSDYAPLSWERSYESFGPGAYVLPPIPAGWYIRFNIRNAGATTSLSMKVE